VVRESPDVILIGEMRDLDTMQAAISAALTGHLVISTMHTSDTVLCVERIINHFPEQIREQVASDLSLALEAIVGQRLVPAASGNGFLPVLEILKATPLVRNLIATRSYGDLEDSLRKGYEDGMVTFNRALADLFRVGKITIQAGAAAATNRDEFISLTQGLESGIETFRESFHEDEPERDDRVTLKRLLHSAVANDASDLILTAGSRPILRVDGSLNPLAIEPLTAFDTRRLLFSVLNSHQRAAFEEKREIDLALTVSIRRSKDSGSEGQPFRFRVNGFFQRGNVASAIRIIPQKILSPEELGLPFTLVKMIEKRQGLILITGPTGHGKSTTLASLIDRINTTRPCHIITVEDPIEYVHANKKAVVEQREVLSDTHSFSNALKYVLRQDPDVILIGEMRDTETIASALTAAETGHLVMATLHTNTAYQSVDRIIDAFPAHHQNQIRMQLSMVLLGAVAQRLIPCKEGKGRIPCFEILTGTTAVKSLIREGKTHMIPSTMETASKDGMVTMDKALDELFRKGSIGEYEYRALKSSYSDAQAANRR
jgi:twitching motility protein PilT